MLTSVFFTFSGSVQSQPGEISEFTQASMFNAREIVEMGLSKTHNKTIKIFFLNLTNPIYV